MLNKCIEFSETGITVPTHSSLHAIKGCTTRLITPLITPVKNKIAYTESCRWYWSSCEYSANNAWNVNFSTGQVNNNNNKYNANAVRPLIALTANDVKGWLIAYKECLSNKRTSYQGTLYNLGYERDILNIAREVKTRNYEPSTSICFVVSRPKYREIFAANFRDRIAQHWVTHRLEPLFEERFQSQGDVSFNCRKGYGTLKAVDTLAKNMEEVSNHYTKEAFVGKFDIKSFFMSIDKTVLLKYLIPFIKEKYSGEDKEDLIWLTEKIVLHNPQDNCIKTGVMENWDKLPPEKSLFNVPRGIGMPIGNITSQLFANFYMSIFDEMMIEECKKNQSRYVRFVDDFVVVSPRKAFIKYIYKKADKFLKEVLNIELHKYKVYIQDVKKGVKFVGGIIKPGRKYLANTTVGGFYNSLYKLDSICCQICVEDINKNLTVDMLRALDDRLKSINSYLGFLVQKNTYAIRYRAMLDCSWLFSVCYSDPKSRVIRAKREYTLKYYFLNKTRHDRTKKTRYRNISSKRKKNLRD